MEPTVLAGAIEFSPAEIALFIAVLIVAFIVVTAPGWVVLSIVMARRPGPGATSGRRWAAGVGGAVAGLAISAAAGSLVGLVPADGALLILALPAAWTACWALAALLNRGRSARAASIPAWQPPFTGAASFSPPTAQPPTAQPPGEGWGR